MARTVHASREMGGGSQGPDRLLTHFAAENHESMIFMIVGVCASNASAVLWRGDGNYHSLAYPLTSMALIQIAVGSALCFHTDRQVETLARPYPENCQHFRAAEISRMNKLNGSLRLYKYVEITLLPGGSSPPSLLVAPAPHMQLRSV